MSKESVQFHNDETVKHIRQVRNIMGALIRELCVRAERHDLSKLVPPELGVFAEYTPKLKTCTYGSDEYKGYLKEMGVALEHHYQNNRHHPEHFSNGINGMTLVDLLEMFCDWKAATLRHNDGDIVKSIELNQKRFGYSDDIKNILHNTATFLEDEL